MTLIIEIYNETKGSVAYISDCLASPMNKSARSADFLPLQWQADEGVKTYGSSLVSKAFTGTDRILLCSGISDQFLPVAREFLDQPRLAIQWIQDGIDTFYGEGQGRMVSESYIYGFREGGNVRHADSLCERFRAGDYLITYAGTGSACLEEFFKDSGSPPPEAAFGNVVIEIFAELVRQWFRWPTISSEGFGGAYEIFIFDKGGPKRIAYQIFDEKCDLVPDESGVPNTYRMFPRSSRLIRCVPHDKGSHFYVISGDGENSLARHFYAGESFLKLQIRTEDACRRHGKEPTDVYAPACAP